MPASCTSPTPFRYRGRRSPFLSLVAHPDELASLHVSSSLARCARFSVQAPRRREAAPGLAALAAAGFAARAYHGEVAWRRTRRRALGAAGCAPRARRSTARRRPRRGRLRTMLLGRPRTAPSRPQPAPTPHESLCALQRARLRHRRARRRGARVRGADHDARKVRECPRLLLVRPRVPPTRGSDGCHGDPPGPRAHVAACELRTRKRAEGRQRHWRRGDLSTRRVPTYHDDRRDAEMLEVGCASVSVHLLRREVVRGSGVPAWSASGGGCEACSADAIRAAPRCRPPSDTIRQTQF